MSSLRGTCSLALSLILVACAGPSPTTLPTTLATARPTTDPSTVLPTADLTPTTAATTRPQPSGPGTTPPAPTGTPLVGSWVQRTDVVGGPSAREDHTWTVNEEETIAYLFGGRGPGGASNELWAFDLVADSWSQVTQTVDTPIPAPRFGHTATWVPEVGLVIWSGQAGSSFFDDIWSWDPEAGMWLQLPSLGAVPPARYGSCASLGPDGELWISHGFTGDSGRFSDTRSYDFAAGTWTDRTPVDRVPVERCLHDCYWTPGGQLILYGGQTTGVAALGDIWAFDLASGAWAQGVAPEAPERQLYALARIGVRSIVFGGGAIDGGFLNDSWLINGDLSLSSVSPIGVLPAARSGAALITDRAGRLLLFGGLNGDGALADLWELPFGAI